MVNEVLPPQPKRRGRQKKREIIGLYGANRDTRSGIIDIAMLQSMGDADEIKPWLRDYGMVIVDECHHVPAVSFEQVLKSVSAKYIYTPLVICATGKFIGEGFDDARLDTLFLTMPISWHGTLAQYVGRLHRLHEGKCEVRVYDYIDNHAVMLEKMYHKRLKGYASIGYSVSTEQQDVALGSDIIYDQITFQERFLQDIAQARESVVIVSPYVTSKRVRWIEAALQPCTQKQVNVSIITRTPTSLPVSSRKAGEIAIGLLRAYPIHIIFREGIHQKFAIIDGSIVWYGSINLLSFSTSQESIMRLHSSSIARALIDKAEGEAL